MAKVVVATFLGISIALLQFWYLIMFWCWLFTGNYFYDFIYTGLYGAMMLVLLLIGLILYPQMPYRKAILGTLIGTGVAVVLNFGLLMAAFNHSWF